MTLDFRRGFAHPDERDAYLAGLNRCFPGWGDEARFGWCFERQGGGLTPDLLWLADDAGRAVAGIALVYRHARLNGERTARIAMYSGAWTRPEARGAGAYARLIDLGRAVAARRDALAIVSFVTADNASRRGLERLGSLMVPSYYCRSAAAAGSPSPAVTSLPSSALGAGLFPAPAGATCLAYARAEWHAQFPGRPGVIEAVGHDGHWRALLERTPAFDRVLAIEAAASERLDAIDALTARAVAAERQLFLFETDPAVVATLDARGFAHTDGFVSVLPAAGAADTCPTNWFLQNGDRM